MKTRHISLKVFTNPRFAQPITQIVFLLLIQLLNYRFISKKQKNEYYSNIATFEFDGKKPDYCKYIDFFNQRISPQLKEPIFFPTRVELCLSGEKFKYKYPNMEINHTKLTNKALAVLVFCHNNFKTVYKMIKAMDHPEVMFYIHIDKKSKHVWNFNSSNLILLPRENVFYYGFTMVTSLLSAYYQILTSSDYFFRHIAYISGYDYPLIPVSSIIKLLDYHRDIDFITIFEMRNMFGRIYEYHNFDHYFTDKFVKKLSYFFPAKRKLFNHYFAGNNWCILTTKTIKQLLEFVEHHNDIVNYFLFSSNADEMMIHTFIYTFMSDFKLKPTLSYGIIGSNGAALDADEELLENAYKSKKIFIRKVVDNKNDKIIKKIRKYGEKSILNQEILNQKYSNKFKDY